MIVILYYKLELLHFYNYCRHTEKHCRCTKCIKNSLEEDKQLGVPKYAHYSEDNADFPSYNLYL